MLQRPLQVDYLYEIRGGRACNRCLPHFNAEFECEVCLHARHQTRAMRYVVTNDSHSFHVCWKSTDACHLELRPMPHSQQLTYAATSTGMHMHRAVPRSTQPLSDVQETFMQGQQPQMIDIAPVAFHVTAFIRSASSPAEAGSLFMGGGGPILSVSQLVVRAQTRPRAFALGRGAKKKLRLLRSSHLIQNSLKLQAKA